MAMVNKRVVFGCNSGYSTCKENVSSFRFPAANPELLQKWIKFVNRADWIPTKNSVICCKHFESKFLNEGKRTKLHWKLNSIPTVHAAKGLQQESSLQTPTTSRKPPTSRIYQPDELLHFNEKDKIRSLNEVTEKHCPPGYLYHKAENHILMYNLCFDNLTGFPAIQEAIKIDSELHLQLQYRGNPVPLPPWFREGRTATLTRFSMLQNLPSYLRTSTTKLQNRQNYKLQGRPPYSSELIRLSLLLRYTSLQSYNILLEYFPLPSLSLLAKLKSSSVDSIKAAQVLRENKAISEDIILMADEMYLRKKVQYSGGEYVGANKDGNLYKGIVVFMVCGLKKTLPIVVKASPETKLNGTWMSEQLEECVCTLAEAGFKVRAIVTDNHSANVAAFSMLRKKFPGGGFFFQHPKNSTKIYLFFDNVHLIKNVRNNLLNCHKFVFPSFSFQIKNKIVASSDAGFISWSDMQSLLNRDVKLEANLRKASKLSFEALHPGHNKQNVNLALAIFHETTIAASKAYFPDRTDMAGFLSLINTWWTIANSKQQYHPNALGNAIVNDDGKVEFLLEFAEWLENWSLLTGSRVFCLSKQACDALIKTLRSQALLTKRTTARRICLCVDWPLSK